MDDTTRESGQIGVFLLDDHEIVRKGVRDLLEAEPDIVVVGEAGTATSRPWPAFPRCDPMWRCSTCACPTATA